MCGYRSGGGCGRLCTWLEFLTVGAWCVGGMIPLPGDGLSAFLYATRVYSIPCACASEFTGRAVFDVKR